MDEKGRFSGALEDEMDFIGLVNDTSSLPVPFLVIVSSSSLSTASAGGLENHK